MLSSDYQKRDINKESKNPEKFDAFIYNNIGKIKSLYPYKIEFKKQANIIYNLSLSFQSLDNNEFNNRLKIAKRNGALGDLHRDENLLNEALALVCEASFRVFNMRPYVVQIMGALALWKNFIIQMQTGEGKTITASLAGVLNGWLAKPCHIVTSNDYLAKRDADIMRDLYERCYLSVGSILPDMEDPERRENYLCDIVYSTSNDILADFLRDQMASEYALDYDKYLINKLSKKDEDLQVMRGIYSIIIDEADSVLADEATTPLIISIPRENKPLERAIISAREIAKKLKKVTHYTINKAYKEIYFTDDGEDSIDKLSQYLPPIWKSRNRREYLLRQALIAIEFYENGSQYVVDDGKIVM